MSDELAEADLRSDAEYEQLASSTGPLPPTNVYRKAKWAIGEIDALQARVAELSTQHLHLSNEVEALEEWNFWLSRTLRNMARRATGLRRNAQRVVERRNHLAEGNDRLRARVDLLTTALTELITLHERDVVFDGVAEMSASWANARAVLSAGEGTS